MYMCLCKAVTDKQIREAVCGGACKMRDLRESLGLASQCGRCGKASRALVEETLKSLQKDNTMSDKPQSIPIHVQNECHAEACAAAAN